MLDKSLIDEISRKADIVTVVGSYLNLVKKGKLFLAICPFHDDKNPSLQVNPERNTFHCWVDGHSGNAISFVMQYENLQFVDAVKKVAQIIGFDDPRLHEKNSTKKIDDNLMPLIKCIDDLNRLYEYNLKTSEGANASKYLQSRNITEDMCKKFHIGFSSDDGEKTIKFLQSKGHSLKTIEEIGISNNLGQQSKDSNHGRITFAISDNNNQVVGFSARRLKEDDGPKYVNSPETKLFIKSTILYNFYNAKEIAKKAKYIYLLEGFMDVIALDKVEIYNAIALMGTALSKEHINMLKKLNVEVRLCLDGDMPGQEATKRILPQLLEQKIPVQIVNNLNESKDPDEILNKSGKEALIKYLNNLLSPFDFTINYYKNTSKLETIEDKKSLIKQFMPLLISTNSQIELDDYIYKLQDVTNISAKAIKDAVKKYKLKAVEHKDKQFEEDLNFNNLISEFHPERKELRKLEIAEREILFHMLTKEDAIKFYEEKIEYFYTAVYRELANYIVDFYSRNNNINISGLISNIENSDAKNKDLLRNKVDEISSENMHFPFSVRQLEICKNTIEKEKKEINKKEQIAKATLGKSDEEKARIINDIIRSNK